MLYYFVPLCVKDGGERSKLTSHLKFTRPRLRFGSQGNVVQRFPVSHLGLGTQGNVVFFAPPLRQRSRRAKRLYLASPLNPFPPEVAFPG